MSHVRRQPLIEPVRQGINLVTVNGQARRHCVPPARHEQPRLARRDDGRAQVDTGDRAARPLADPIFVYGNDDGRLARLFLNAAGDDANHPRVPAFARQQRHGAIMLSGKHGLGLLLHNRFNCAAFLVQAVEFHRDVLRLERVFGNKQPHTKVGFADAAAGIDARAQGKAKVGTYWRAGEAAGLNQRREADVAARGHDL